MVHIFLTSLLVSLGGIPGFQPGPAPLTNQVELGGSFWTLTKSEGPLASSPRDTAQSRWILIPEDSEARYRVREQLAGFDFPNDAVGVTSEVRGTLILDAQGGIVEGASEFRIDLASLSTDNERRDGYVRRRTLEVEQFPEAVLIPIRFVGHPAPLPEAGSASFQLEADLTVHGQTASTVWEVTCDFGPEGIKGLATTAFPFDRFGIAVPKVARVLSVDDNIRLELEFRVVREER